MAPPPPDMAWLFTKTGLVRERAPQLVSETSQVLRVHRAPPLDAVLLVKVQVGLKVTLPTMVTQTAPPPPMPPDLMRFKKEKMRCMTSRGRERE